MSDSRPNILFIMSDDHASHAISSYGSRINETPHIDRLAAGGMRFDNCFCTNSICTPSRATILDGTYNHVNGVTTLHTHMDNRRTTFPKLLREAGYQTAIVGKWHLGQGPKHEPTGFDFWSVLPGQGAYYDPEMIEMGQKKTFPGYVSDIITEKSINWLRQAGTDRPWMLLCHHKAPHRHWQPGPRHRDMYADVDIPEPETLFDDYSDRATAAREAKMRIADMGEVDTKVPPPPGLSGPELTSWKYQRYIKDYLRCVAGVDDSVGAILDYLDETGQAENTIVIYTSDQGFFLGDHGWYDKRFMYEESLRMPFLVRFPREISPETVNDDIVLNVDFAPTFLDIAGVEPPDAFQGRSFRELLGGRTPGDWQKSMYYRYWMHRDGIHNAYAHYGLRTHRHKLIYYYADGLDQPGAEGEPCEPEWELFDLESDPRELHNVYHDPACARTVKELTDELNRLQAAVGDEPYTAR
ncbi:MAG: sulfatase family protein [Phycisphaerae bacterium]